MSYRTYIYYGDEKEDQKDYKCFQILGNNEYYDEWFDEMVRQGMISQKELEENEYCYGTKFEDDDDDIFDDTLVCEIKDIMGFVRALEKVVINLEKERIESNKGSLDNSNILSYFDFSGKYKKIKDSNGKIKLTDELFNILNGSYLMMPLTLLKTCEECLEPVPYDDVEDVDRVYNFRIKKGKKIFISAG